MEEKLLRSRFGIALANIRRMLSAANCSQIVRPSLFTKDYFVGNYTAFRLKATPDCAARLPNDLALRGAASEKIVRGTSKSVTVSKKPVESLHRICHCTNL